jgi:flagellar protein FlgJ
MANAIPTNAVDLTGLGDLRRRAHREDPAALAEVAVQFEALFIGMMLDSARSATLGSGILDGDETEQYLSLMDRQVALELAKSGGFGFAEMLVRELSERGAVGDHVPRNAAPRAPAPVEALAPPVAPSAEPPPTAATSEFPGSLPASLAALGGAVPAAESTTPTPAEFIAALKPEAESAAAALGVEPRLLLAQAALETGWGKAVPQRGGGESAHNLFGIKAGGSWAGDFTASWTLEHVDGVTSRELERFRVYDSTAGSFADYVNLISSGRRYAGALENAGDAQAYARAVTAAGYATDPNYADKWLAIYHGERLKQALRGMDLPDANAVTTK